MVDTLSAIDVLDEKKSDVKSDECTKSEGSVGLEEPVRSKESLYKQTQDLISTLGDEQLKKVYVFTASLMKEDNPFKPVTKAQVLADLDASDADIAEDRVKDAHRAMNDIRRRLGMPV